ncbi:MAG: uroporphyrinogen decarboxylase [bacterium]|nr:uroporphyrinogen decarboxylase [bacterium]
MLKNDNFLRACRREKTDYTPVWMMRQAGRYLPEYLATRKKAGDFLTLCKTPDLAAEVTLQPIDRFNLDAAILFSDILVIPEAMGMELQFLEGEGPHFPNPVRDADAIEKLADPDPMQELAYVMNAIKAINKGLDGRVPLIGFTGAPWTLATYMVEGGGSKNFAVIKKMLYDRPELLHAILEKTTRAVINYLKAQIESGVHAVQIFDTWGGILTPDDFDNFSLQYIQMIVEEIKGEVPTIVFAKGAGHMLESIAETGCDVVGVDWMADIGDVRRRIGGRVALQGNMDPCNLYASPDAIRRKVADILAKYGEGSGHIFNLGHGILPDIPVDHAKAFIDAVHELSPAYHK